MKIPRGTRVWWWGRVTGLAGEHVKGGVVIGGGSKCARVRVDEFEGEGVDPWECNVPWSRLRVDA